jgi:HD-like signal output (HDOD) protein
MHDLTELKRLVGSLDESTRKLEFLLEPGYGGTASELVRLLQEQEARDATAINRLAELEEVARRWYLPDGSFETLANCEEVTLRRQAAARHIADLTAMLRRALSQIEPTSETAVEVRRDGFRLLNTIELPQDPAIDRRDTTQQETPQ